MRKAVPTEVPALSVEFSQGEPLPTEKDERAFSVEREVLLAERQPEAIAVHDDPPTGSTLVTTAALGSHPRDRPTDSPPDDGVDAAPPLLPWSVPQWLGVLGKDRRSGLAKVAADIGVAAAMAPGGVFVSLSWPSPPPSALLAWAVSHLGRAEGSSDPLRVLMVGGCGDTRLLKDCSISRDRARFAWPPELASSEDPMQDAMATALRRLKPEAPDALPVSSLVPVLRARSDADRPWPDRWSGYLEDTREFLPRRGGGKFGFLRDRYGLAASTRPFAFLLPQVSRGNRRVEEIKRLPGGMDLIVADFSAKWLWPSRVKEEVCDLLLDVAIATRGSPAPRCLVLVSDPRSRIAALSAIKDIQDTDTLPGRRTSRSHHYVGDRSGRRLEVASGHVPLVSIHAASTTEADIQTELLRYAAELRQDRAKTSEALRSAAFALSAMSSSIAPPLAGDDDPETTRTFVDAASEVRSAMADEGMPPDASSIESALRRGRDVATRLMRASPGRMALEEAREAAAAGRRVAFVAESDAEAKQAAADASGRLLIASRRTMGSEIAKHRPDLIVTACRAADALRIVAEQPRPPREVTLLLQPIEAMTMASIAELVLETPEFVSAHPLCRRICECLPPTFPGLPREDYLAVRPPRRGNTGSFGKGHARDGVRLVTEDGDVTYFAPGAILITMVDGVPRHKRAADIESGMSVVIIPEDTADRIARELGWAGEAALLDEQVGRYKVRVREWKEGPGAGLTTRQIQGRLRALDPVMPEPSDATIRYWLSAGEAEDIAAPRASNRPQWLAAFCKMIDLKDADRVFAHFEHHRGRLQRAGQVRSGLLERFLFDPFDAVIHRGVSLNRARQLREIAMDSARTVISAELPPNGDER